MSHQVTASCLLALGLAAGLTTGCSDSHSTTKTVAQNQPQISIVTANRTVAVGDTATLTVNSKNTLGQDAKLEWVTTGGKLTTENDHRTAHVRFDQPGAYTITAKLMINGRVYDQDSVTMDAKALR
jgi:uncharacterized protein YfaS (alpha-2-macroglobulin family)